MKSYVLEVIENGDGKPLIRSRCDGFSSLELLGIIEWKRDDICRQMRGEMVPDSVKREVVSDDA